MYNTQWSLSVLSTNVESKNACDEWIGIFGFYTPCLKETNMLCFITNLWLIRAEKIRLIYEQRKLTGNFKKLMYFLSIRKFMSIM